MGLFGFDSVSDMFDGGGAGQAHGLAAWLRLPRRDKSGPKDSPRRWRHRERRVPG